MWRGSNTFTWEDNIMSTTATTTRQSVTNRAVATHRRVVVPDRMILRASGGAAAPIINKQSHAARPVQANLKHQPIASAKVHMSVQKKSATPKARPATRHVKPLVVHDMTQLLARHNAMPRHLARAASRAHLLSQLVQPEPKKPRWHQRVFAGLMS